MTKLATNWWKFRSEYIMYFYCLLMVAVGVIGLAGNASPALAVGLGGSLYAFSVGMIGAGVTTFFCSVFGWRRGEMVGMFAFAILTIIYAVIVFLVTDASGDQTGMRLLAGAVSIVGWADSRWQTGLKRQDIAVHIEEAIEQMEDNTGGSDK